MEAPIANNAHKGPSPDSEAGLEDATIGVINETGHVQELERNFSLLSICSVGIVTGNTWAALGGSIAVAIYNGGPPGVIYEFIAVSLFYWLVAASLAELASSMPSSAGVYHWASITPGPKYGRINGWFAGYWNYFAWVFGSASCAAIVANCCVAMYNIYHPDFVPHRWHIFITYLIVTWLCCAVVLFCNRALPMINNFGLFFIIGGCIITILVVAILPSTHGSGHASNSFVWSDWSNQTGWSSNGFVFLAGMLNGAYAVGTPDCVSHLAEELPQPRKNIPLAIAAQMIIGFLTALFYMIAIFYAISSLEDVLASSIPTFPLAVIYAQATGSNAGTIGLLVVVMCPIICSCIGTYITSGRTLWTLARDEATPFPSVLGKIHPRHHNPFNATLACGVVSTILGCIYVGSSTAFNAFVGSFVLLTTLSYLAAILPFILTGRFRSATGAVKGNGMRPGPFAMRPVVGYAVNIISCAYIVVFFVIYCFPYAIPFNAVSMNYSSLITGGLTIFVGIWFLIKGGRYVGPKALGPHGEMRAHDEAFVTEHGRENVSSEEGGSQELGGSHIVELKA